MSTPETMVQQQSIDQQSASVARKVGDTCKVCGNSANNQVYVVREMMYGFREEFPYVECSSCGCLWLRDVPEDLSKYYPEEYYSFNREPDSPFKMFCKRRRVAYAFGRRDPIGWLMVKRYGMPPLAEWMRLAGSTYDDPILDVGSGAGWILLDLANAGFRNLTGVDPYISGDIHYPNGVNVLKRELSEVEGEFQCVMMHHSFEHMADPLAVLREVHRILRPGGCALVRLPVAAHTWREYRANWVQLDAPRHLFIPSVRSMELLAEKTGFRVADVVFDSGAYQFIGSEQYKRDISMYDGRSYFVDPKGSIFSEEECRAFQVRAEELNRRGEGDAAGFYLRKER